MVLSKVIYHLYESDVQHLDANQDLEFHEIDREVCLVVDRYSIYISWRQYSSENDHADFGVFQQCESYFVNETPIERDYSGDPIWKPLIGHKVEIVELESESRAIEVRGADHSVFCSPFEEGRWGVDVLHISLTLPRTAA